MALNFDKLNQLRNNYNKPKFALKECEKRLQRQPKDPYLLTWRAELLIETHQDVSAGLSICQTLCKREPPITDMKLMVLLYSLITQAKQTNGESFDSAGPEVQALWQNAIKSCKRKSERDLWCGNFFEHAVTADCWEDVRWVLMQTKKDNNTTKIVFCLALAYQILAENNGSVSGNLKAKMQGDMAHRILSTAFQNASSKPDAVDKVSDGRSLRFVVQVFKRQKRNKELLDLLSDPSPQIAAIVNANKLEFMRVRLDLLAETLSWQQLWEESHKLLTGSLNRNSDTQKPDSDSWRTDWKVWMSLCEATRQIGDSDHTNKAHQLLTKYEKTSPSRERLLATLLLVRTDQECLTDHCRRYWQNYHGLSSCFKDLKFFMDGLEKERRESFLKDVCLKKDDNKPSSQGPKKELESWLQTAVNVLKLEYLINVSQLKEPKVDVIESFVLNALKLLQTGADIQSECHRDVGMLAYIALLKLHDAATHYEKLDAVEEYKDMNERFLLQAALLSRFLTDGKEGTQNRPMVLLAVQLHMALGLGSIAFGMYSKARVKELLNESLSYMLLTRVSQIHPFDGKTFSPDAELGHVIGAYHRMEDKTDDLLGANVYEVFQYDQAFEMLDLKRNLKHSLNKHLCVLERRRIARLKGEVCDERDLEFVDFRKVPLPDNRDFEFYPNFESEHASPPASLYTRSNTPKFWSFPKHYVALDEIWSKTTGERQMLGSQAQRDFIIKAFEESKEPANSSATEDMLHGIWSILQQAVDHVFGDDSPTKDKATLVKTLQNLPAVFSSLEKDLQHRAETDKTTQSAPVDAHILPTSQHLQCLFGSLELLRAATKFFDHLSSIQKQKGAHKYKGPEVQKAVTPLLATCDSLYKTIRKMTDARMEKAQKIGMQSLMAQARYGKTGQALLELIGEDRFRGWARECVDSTAEAYEGVSRVKLR